MAKKRLTDMTVSNTKAPSRGGKRLEIWDTVLPGFGLRITPQPHDARSYFVMTMVGRGEIVRDDSGNIIAGRRLKRITIGNARVIRLDDARERAREMLDRAEAGEDPTQPQVAVPTFRDFVAGYINRRKGSLRASTSIDLGRTMREISGRWGDRLIDEIRAQDVVAWIDDKAAVSPIRANRQLSALRTLFADAERRGLIESNPVAKLKPPNKERSRERALTDDEIAIIWQATAKMGWPYGSFYRLLLLTGQRRGQAVQMTWEEVDLDRRTWTTPGHKMKAGKEHVVALSDLAIEVLSEAHERGNGSRYVFSCDGINPLGGFAKARARLDRMIAQVAGKPLPEWHVHDFRRTLVHGLAAMGIAPHIADKILAHSSGAISGTAAVYNKFAYLDERRDALAAWGRKIATLIGRQPSNVTPLVAKR
jgi:integrase